MKKTALVKWVAWHLVVAMFIMGLVPRAEAGFSPSETIATAQIDRTADLRRIQKILETKMIRTRLDELGFSKDEIRTRLDRLDDGEIHALALRLDELRVGGGGFEVLVIILLLAILVGVWLYVGGKKVVVQNR